MTSADLASEAWLSRNDPLLVASFDGVQSDPSSRIRKPSDTSLRLGRATVALRPERGSYVRTVTVLRAMKLQTTRLVSLRDRHVQKQVIPGHSTTCLGSTKGRLSRCARPVVSFVLDSFGPSLFCARLLWAQSRLDCLAVLDSRAGRDSRAKRDKSSLRDNLPDGVCGVEPLTSLRTYTRQLRPNGLPSGPEPP